MKKQTRFVLVLELMINFHCNVVIYLKLDQQEEIFNQVGRPISETCLSGVHGMLLWVQLCHSSVFN